MKIVMLCDFYAESLEYQENLLVRYYRKHGHEVVVIASTFDSVFDYYNDLHDKKKPRRTYEDQGATIIKLPYRFNIINRLRAYVKIDDILEREAPDLIYVHDIMLNFPECVRYVKRNPECKMIMDYHADYSNSGKNALSRVVLHGVARKWILDRARPYLSRIFPVVPASAAFLREIYNVSDAEMEILPLGGDADLADEVLSSGDRPKLRELHGISSEDIVIITGGKLTPAKRTELLLQAVRGLTCRTKIHVVVIGASAPVDESYRQSIEASVLGKAGFHFVGWLSTRDVYRYLNMADIAVFPASQSIVWQQAILMGLPLIVGDVGHQDISYLNLEQNITVLPREKIDPKSIAGSIQDLLDDPERLRVMHEGALRVGAEHLNWNRLIDRTLRFNRSQPT